MVEGLRTGAEGANPPRETLRQMYRLDMATLETALVWRQPKGQNLLAHPRVMGGAQTKTLRF